MPDEGKIPKLENLLIVELLLVNLMHMQISQTCYQQLLKTSFSEITFQTSIKTKSETTVVQNSQ